MSKNQIFPSLPKFPLVFLDKILFFQKNIFEIFNISIDNIIIAKFTKVLTSSYNIGPWCFFFHFCDF
jgi:hypothetical protein